MIVGTSQTFKAGKFFYSRKCIFSLQPKRQNSIQLIFPFSFSFVALTQQQFLVAIVTQLLLLTECLYMIRILPYWHCVEWLVWVFNFSPIRRLHFVFLWWSCYKNLSSHSCEPSVSAFYIHSFDTNVSQCSQCKFIKSP